MLLLQPPGAFDFHAVLRYLERSPSALLEQVEPEAGRYLRALRLEGTPAIVEVSAGGVRDSVRVEVKSHPALEAAAAAIVGRSLLLDVDAEAFREAAAADAVLAGLVERFHGLRPVLLPDPYETLIWAILGQQINVGFARRLKLRLVELCGDSLTGDDGTWLGVMPTPAQVAAMDPDVLAANQFSRQKAAYIRDISRAVVEGELDFAQVGELPQDEAVEQLRRFKGIGRWTAEYLLMRGYGARDALPAADVGLQIYVGRAYGFGRKATEAEVREIAERVKGWRGWAAFYWWTALQSDRD